MWKNINLFIVILFLDVSYSNTYNPETNRKYGSNTDLRLLRYSHHSGRLEHPTVECTPADFFCQNKKCINIAWKCDGDDDCDDNSDEADCPTVTCAEDFFRCDSGKCIPERWLCDGTFECPDESDEKPEYCNNTCKGYQCQDSYLCIDKMWKCDGQPDCPDEDDERECNGTCDEGAEFQCNDKRCIPARWRCDHREDCEDGSDEHDCKNMMECDPTGEVKCKDGECIHKFWLCDGDSDCKDGSDELDCFNLTRPDQICGTNEFHCEHVQADIQCIHSSWRCDDDHDCADGSDEKDCGLRSCSPHDIVCDNGTCISEDFVCDGERDCLDGADEQNCTHLSTCNEFEFDCGSLCIPATKFCDGTDDCGNGIDEPLELNCTGTTSFGCRYNNGGCRQECLLDLSEPHHYKCGCYPGFKLMENSASVCEDIDECQIFGICSQACINTPGSYKCECFAGYSMTGTHHCKDKEGMTATLILSDLHDVRKYSLDSKHTSLLFNDQVPGVLAMDFDIRNKALYYTDNTEKILMANMSTGVKKVIIDQNLHTPEGLAVDWVNKNLYISDTYLDKIEVARLDGSSRKTLVNENLYEPRFLVVDPNNGWFYWSDWGIEPKIEKCGMNGQHRKTIVTKGLSWPNGLTIDYVQQRLYWADAKLRSISSCDLDGNNYKTVLKNHRYLGHPYGITVFEDFLFWTDWMTNAVHRASKLNHENVSTIALSLKTPMAIQVYHVHRQPETKKVCGENNGGCSHLCLPIPQLKKTTSLQKLFECACPDNMMLVNSVICKSLDVTIATKKLPPATGVSSPNWPPTLQPLQKDTTLANQSEGNAQLVPQKSSSMGESSTQTSSGSHFEAVQKDESDGVIAGIVIIVVFVLGFFVILVIYMALRRYKSKNVKSMNFDNPVYRKTTTEDMLTIYDSRSNLPQSMQPLYNESEPA